MHWLKNSNSPSSSSHSPKSTNSHLNSKRWAISDIKLFRNPNKGPRLTRSRKLRHASDLNFGDLKLEDSDSRGSYNASENSTTVARSSSNLELRYGRLEPSGSLSPLPLPHPGASKNLGGEKSNFPPASESFPLPSPLEASNTNQLGLDGPADLSSSRYASPRFQNQITRKGLEQIDARANESASDRSRIFVPKIGDYEDEPWNVPRGFWGAVVSAPASGYSSPILSPRRLSIGNFIPHVPNGTYEPNGCFPRDLSSLEKILNSPDRSTIPSSPIRSPSPKSKPPSAPSSPLHPNLSNENSFPWHENNSNVNARPLPLPPGPSNHSQSSFIYQHTLNTNPEVSPISNQWRKGKLIGSGSFGSVYVATHRETGALCAIKEVNLIPDDTKSAECMKQLEQEIKVLKLLKHQNIVQYYGSEITEDHFYIYLEYVHPGSIYNYIRNHGLAITEAIVRNFTRHILSGLAYLHSTNTVHRDIKGANLLVNTSGVVKLADFGLAKHLSGSVASHSMKGSAHWMAPEIMLSASPEYDTSVDIWSLGCTVIEMYTGKPPWGELPPAAAMFNILRKEVPIPETLSAEGKDFLCNCLRKKQTERPSAQKLLDHPFVRQSFPGRSPMDTLPSPRQHPNFILNMPPISPRSFERTQFSQVDNSSNNNGHSPEKSNSAASVSRHSPRSTLETFPNVSPPHTNHGSTRYPTSHFTISNRFHPTSPGRDWTHVLPK